MRTLAIAAAILILGVVSQPMYAQMYRPRFDNHRNFAYSTVLTAPVPGDRGTWLTVETGQGGRFPAGPFNATVWPAGDQPLDDNAEIVRVMAVAGDVLTIARAQEGSRARWISVGDQIAATITAKTLTDIEYAVVLRVVHGDSQGSRFSSGSYTLRNGLTDGLRLKWVVPPDYAGGDVAVRVYLRGLNGSTGQIRLRRNSFRFRMDAASSQFEANLDANHSFNVANEVEPYVFTVSSADFQPGDLLQFNVVRLGAEGNDMMNADVEFHAATYEYAARVMQ